MIFFEFDEEINKETEFAIFGIPWDYLTSIKAPNSSIAPQIIRDVTKNLALTTELGMSIPELKVVDIGDVNIISNEVDTNISEIKNYVNNCTDWYSVRFSLYDKHLLDIPWKS